MAEPIKIQFRPGINRESTDYGNTGGWYDCNLARVRTGTWSSMGGWVPFTTIPVLGTMRSLFPWSLLNGSRYYGVGTAWKYYVIRGNMPNDVTPIRRTVTLANDPFAIVNGSAVATVTDVAHGAVVNDFVTFSGATTIGGNVTAAVLNQEYQILQIVSDDVYTITLTVVSDTSTWRPILGGFDAPVRLVMSTPRSCTSPVISLKYTPPSRTLYSRSCPKLSSVHRRIWSVAVLVPEPSPQPL